MRNGASRWVPTLAALGLLWATGLHATTLERRLQLPDLVAESTRAALFRVTDVRHDYDARGLHSTFVTLRVDDTLYGAGLVAPGGRMTIKLYGSRQPLPDGSRLIIEGTPDLRVGRQYLLLLRDGSAWGFTGVAGLFQGVFEVDEDHQGRKTATALAGNRSVFGSRGLKRWVDPSTLTRLDRALLERDDQSVPYEVLRRTVLQLHGEVGP